VWGPTGEAETVEEKVMLAYAEDVLKQTIEHMTSFDPEWKVPEGFFLDSIERRRRRRRRE
jgi:hypothetical protein